jgi:hypothetical protein
MSNNPYIREIGAVTDYDGARCPVGVDYSTVTIDRFRFTIKQLDELLQLISEARPEASQNGELFEEEDKAGA